MVSTIASALLYVRYIPFSYQQVGGDKLEEAFLNCPEVLGLYPYSRPRQQGLCLGIPDRIRPVIPEQNKLPLPIRENRGEAMAVLLFRFYPYPND